MGQDNPALNIKGLTWADENDDLGQGNLALAEIVALVAKAHKKRLGRKPNLILVHPSVVEEKTAVNGIDIIPASHMIERHYHAVYTDGKGK